MGVDVELTSSGKRRQDLTLEVISVEVGECCAVDDEEPRVDPVIAQEGLLLEPRHLAVLIELHGAVGGGQWHRGDGDRSVMRFVERRECLEVDGGESVAVGGEEGLIEDRLASLDATGRPR